MTHSAGWSPYAGSSSIILAVVLLIVTGLLIYFAIGIQYQGQGPDLPSALPLQSAIAKCYNLL